MTITKEELERIKLNYSSGIVRREDGKLMITAIDEAWAELEALKGDEQARKQLRQPFERGGRHY